MKRNLFIITMLLMAAVTTANAQAHRDSRYYNQNTGRLDYSRGRITSGRPSLGRYTPSYWNMDSYCGFRVGPSFSTLGGDLSNSSTVTGLNAGLVVGTAISHYLPLYFETGLQYTEKGAGKLNYYYDDYSYSTGDVKLNYLEMPLTIKYAYSPDNHFSIQPFVGGYVAYGCNSNFKGDKSVKMFGRNGDFQRFDGGLRVGCGLSFDVLYAEVAYDYGLSNIEKEGSGNTHTSSIQLNFGVNF